MNKFVVIQYIHNALVMNIPITIIITVIILVIFFIGFVPSCCVVLFILNEKYSREDVCKLLNWPKSINPQNIGGYIIQGYNCPIFVTYHKSENISSTINYEDRFVDRSKISWMTKNGRKLNSKEVGKLISPDLNRYLFVMKSDNEDRTFYYLGKIYPVVEEMNEVMMPNSNKSVVNIPMKLKNPVEERLYQYLITARIKQ